jgi:hypothetical protein
MSHRYSPSEYRPNIIPEARQNSQQDIPGAHLSGAEKARARG